VINLGGKRGKEREGITFSKKEAGGGAKMVLNTTSGGKKGIREEN